MSTSKTLNRGTLFDPEVVKDLINKVKGKSSLAVLSKQEAIPFKGQKEFIFTMDSEIDVVAEGGKKSHGGVSLTPIKIVPIKFEYGARVSDEFVTASKEEKMDILKAFNDGFANKVARGLDIAAFHGINPRTGAASDVIGTNHFDNKVTQEVTVPKGLANPNQAIEDAISLVDSEITGMAMSKELRTALSKQKDELGNAMFPSLTWGNSPGEINGLSVDVNSTVKFGKENARAYVGDFMNAFKWGFSNQIPLKVIEYGDPDNSGNDLQGYNQVYLRAEIFLGWGIMDEDGFARIIEGA